MEIMSIKDQVYIGVQKDILNGVYQANDIINEKTLVKKYGVSKTPVREALVHLSSEGMIRNIPRLGYQLTDIAPREIGDVLRFRKTIELGALEECFYDISKKQLAELKEIQHKSENIVDIKDINLHWGANLEFHKKLCSFAENKYLDEALEKALNTCTIISHQYFTKRWNESKDCDATNHRALIEAIEYKNLQLARKTLINDLEAFINPLY